MKKYLIILTALSALTSCGKNVGRDSDAVSDQIITTSSTGSAVSSSTETTITTVTVSDVKPDNNPPDSVILTSLDSLEVYSDIKISDFITDTNTEILNIDETLDTSELGQKNITVTFSYEGKTYEKNISYEVVDTTEPLILNSGWNPYTKIGESFDLNSIVGFADNYDRQPVLSYTGEVDIDTVGNYPITVTVTDGSGNSTSWEMSVLVLNEIPAPEDNNPRVNFTDFIEYYNYENVSYGIDVSAWQTNVDYEAVKSDGCEFVLMRIGYCYDEIQMDDYYRQNIENASNVGLDIGVYFYTTANTEQKAREQARWIVEQLDGKKLDYPIAFDWEEWACFQQYSMNIHDLNSIFNAFCDELEQNGYSGMLYSSKNFLNNFWENDKNYPIWLAHYVDETDYTGTFAIWQASAYGRISGIEGDVDMN
ncbi:MAG: glycoside hydrolase family 25, partial [Ruminococcus sp.]|nr:glycoside hydrolase family 25 [Ruminococcus sp.]